MLILTIAILGVLLFLVYSGIVSARQGGQLAEHSTHPQANPSASASKLTNAHWPSDLDFAAALRAHFDAIITQDKSRQRFSKSDAHFYDLIDQVQRLPTGVDHFQDLAEADATLLILEREELQDVFVVHSQLRKYCNLDSKSDIATSDLRAAREGVLHDRTMRPSPTNLCWKWHRIEATQRLTVALQAYLAKEYAWTEGQNEKFEPAAEDLFPPLKKAPTKHFAKRPATDFFSTAYTATTRNAYFLRLSELEAIEVSIFRLGALLWRFETSSVEEYFTEDICDDLLATKTIALLEELGLKDVSRLLQEFASCWLTKVAPADMLSSCIEDHFHTELAGIEACLLYTSPSPRDRG